MFFKHDLLPRFEIEAITHPNGYRVYKTPDGNFPSVTTVLGWASDKSWLKEWHARVGKEEADRITRQAAARGTAIHNMVEQYILGDEAWKRAMPFDLTTFYPIRDALNENLTLVRGLEFPLWSKRLQTAGRVDLIGEWENIPSIIDFKTAKSFPKKETLDKYLLQTSCYTLMVGERFGINIPRVVLIIARDDANRPSIIVREVEDYRARVETLFSEKNRSTLMQMGEACETLGEGA